MKNVWIFGGVLAGLIILMFVFSNLSKENYNFDGIAPTPEEITESDRTKGNPDANIVLTEYSDFECPACGFYHPVLEELMETYNDEVLFVYRHFPLSQHRNAHLAARVSEAAGEQGMFWEMHDLIFENQNDWRGRNAEPIFEEYAESLSLDMDKFNNDKESDEIFEKVNRDLTSGENAEVLGTPSFFINGEKIQNPQNLNQFISIIESYLE